MNIGALTATLGVDTKGLEQAKVAMEQFKQSANTNLSAVSDSLDKTGRNLYYFGTAATKFLTVPLALGSLAVVKTAKDFEYSMQKIVGLVGESQTQVNSWSKDLLAMGPALGKGPKELADALYFVTSSGFKGAEALGIVEKSAKASASGLGETKTVADLVTSAMSAYASTGLTASHTLDILTAAVREGKGEATDYANHLGDIIPVASEMQISFDQVAGAVAAVTLTGQNASKAVTGIRQALFEIEKPSVTSIANAKAMGISFSDLQDTIQTKGLLAGLKMMSDLTKQHGVSLASVFPNIRAYNSILSLLGDRYTANLKLQENVTNSTGSLDNAYKAIGLTIEQKYNMAVSAVESSLIKMGLALKDSVIPIMESFARMIQNVVQWYLDLSQSQQQFVLKLAIFLAAIGPVTIAVGLLMRAFGGLVSTVGFVIKAFTSLFSLMALNPVLGLTLLITAYVAGMVIFNNITSDATAKQKAFNDEIQRGAALKIDSDSITKRMSVLDQMNRLQLQTTKEQIESNKRAEEDFVLTLGTKLKEALKSNTDLIDLQNQYNEAIKGPQNQYSAIVEASLAGQIKAKKENIAKDLEIQYKANQDRLALLDSYEKQVEAKLAALPSGTTTKVHVDSDSAKRIKEIQKIMDDYHGSLKAIDIESTVIGQSNEYMGKTFDAITPKINVTKSTLQSLFRIPGITGNEPAFKEVISGMSALDSTAAFVTKTMAELNGQLAINKDLSKLMGTSYDLAGANLKDYTNTLEKFGKAGITTGDNIDKLKNDIIAAKDASVLADMTLTKALADLAFQNSIIEKSWDTTNAQKEISDLSAKLQVYTAEMERLQAFKIENPLDPTVDSKLQTMITTVKSLHSELDILNAKQYAIANMGNAFSNLSTIMGNVNLVAGAMGRTIGGVVFEFLNWMNVIFSTVQAVEGIITFVKALTTANKVSTIATTAQSIATGINATAVAGSGVAAAGAAVATTPLIAAQIALAAAYTTAAVAGAAAAAAWVPFPGTIAAIGVNETGLTTALAAAKLASTAAVVGLAEGGIVPAGYPDDKYPAMLTSGEMVVPPGKLPDLQGSGNSEITVKIEAMIKGTDLHYVIKEVERKYKNSTV